MPTDLSAGELLGIKSEEYPTDAEMSTGDHDDVLAAHLRKFKDLRPTMDAKRKKPEINSIDDLDLSHLSPEWQSRLRDMLKKHSKMLDGSLGIIKTTQHHVELKKTPGRSNNTRIGLTTTHDNLSRKRLRRC